MSKAKIAAIVLLAAVAAGAVTADAARAGLPSQTASTKIQDRSAPSVGFAARGVSPADTRRVGPRDPLAPPLPRLPRSGEPFPRWPQPRSVTQGKTP